MAGAQRMGTGKGATGRGIERGCEAVRAMEVGEVELKAGDEAGRLRCSRHDFGFQWLLMMGELKSSR